MSNTANTDHEALESLVGQAADDYTDRVNRGETVEIEEYAQRYPEIADVLRHVLPSLGLMAKLSSAGREAEDLHAKGTTVPEYLGDFRILREIGRGGMGVVYEAEQKSLGRRVALKVLPFHRLLHPLYLKRFQHEAQAAACLHHTNIVPVFGVGEHEGIYFYTMQFIAGRGLDQLIQELKRLRRTTDGTGSLATDADNSTSEPGSITGLAQTFGTGRLGVQIRTELGNATSREPSSECTADGHEITPLSDQTFTQYCRSVASLGKQVAEALSYAHGQGILHRDIKPSNLLLDSAGTVWVTDFGLAKAQTTEDLTRTGDLVGTLRYAAPERLRGQADARSDIFSLGLTLYELVTLRPAYPDRTQEGLIQQVTAADPPTPRSLDRRIPPDLNTIILKAIVKEPERRYSTASELARDLQRFLEDRPIFARRTGQLELAWRWCRRNPLTSGIAAGFLAALLIGLGAVFYQWRMTETQRQRAEANFQKARDAVDECFTIVTQHPALQEPGMEAARQVLFQAALKYYQDFLNQRAYDPSTHLDLGQAYYRLGFITERIGSKSEALTAYQRGCVLFEQLARSDPKNAQVRRDLALCHESLGELYRVTGRSDQAAKEFLTALALRDGLAQNDPKSADDRNNLAGTHRALGLLYRTTGRPKEAESSYLLAQSLRQEILRELPARGEYRKALAQDYSELARVYAATSRPAEAETAIRKGLSTFEELTRDYPDVAEYQDSLATSYNALGSHLLNSGRGDFNQIEREYGKALDIRQHLAREHPKVQEYQSELARVYNNLALWHYIAARNDKSAENYAKALALREQLAGKHPDVIAYQKALAKTHHDLGLLFRRDARWTEADRSFRQALAIQGRLLERNREISDFALELATTISNLGLIARDQGKYRDSIECYSRAVRVLNEVLKTEPKQSDAQRLLGQAYAGRAAGLTNLGDFHEALTDWDRSLEFATREPLSARRLGRAATLAHLGNYVEAVAEADRLTPKTKNGLLQLATCARVYAAVASAAVRDPHLSRAEQLSRAESAAARAMELLTRGDDLGEFNVKADVAPLRLERDFEILRSRPDFIRLLQKIESKGKN